MTINLNWLNLRVLTSSRFLVALFIVVMCTQFVPIEGIGVSPVKVAVMAIAPVIFILKTPQINRAVIWGVALWLTCFFSADFAGPIRWSTLGYFGMFIMTFVCYYSLLRTGEVTVEWFANLVKVLIIIYGVVLILQQISVLAGLTNNPLINLDTSILTYIELTKLPVLNIEPSHAARMLGVLMLAYLECLKILNGNVKPSLIQLFDKQNRWMSCLFLWTMLTMGSGTAFIVLGFLLIYFISFRSAMYMIPLLIGLVTLGSYLDLEQLNRVNKVAASLKTQDISEIRKADGSASVRIVPLLNFFTKTDLSDPEIWTGEGTISKEEASIQWKNDDSKLPMLQQYGLISMIVGIFFVYSCAIKKIFSIETLFYIILFGISLGNVAYIWGALMIFATTRYFQGNASSEECGQPEMIDPDENY